MADAESGCPFGADKLDDMCQKRSEAYQSIKANYEIWCVDQQQKLQAETEQLEYELRQLRKSLTETETEDVRATEELGQLLSRPWTQRDDSPDIEELFAQGDRWNTELRRIRANRDRPGEDNNTILREIERVQNKLEGLPAAYDLIQKEEKRRVREKLGELWQPQRKTQPNSLRTLQNLPEDTTRRQKRLITGALTPAAEEISAPFSASAHEQRRKRSREASLETISSTEFRQSVFPQRPDLHSFSGQACARPDTASPDLISASAPNTSRTSGVFMTRPQRRLSKPSSVTFRDQQGRYQTERARRGRKSYRATPQERRNQGPAPSPTSSRFGRVDSSLLPNVHSEGRRIKNKSAGSNDLESTKYRLSSIRQAEEDTEAIVITSVHSARQEMPNLHGGKTTRQQATRHRSQVSIPDSDRDLPIAKKQKAEKTILFDEVNAENRDWRRGEKIYRIVEYQFGSNKWYIFPCEKHCTGLTTARGAKRHLYSQAHRYIHCTTPQAVRELGVSVVDCDAEKSDRNNDAFDRATEQGYRPNQLCNRENCPVHSLSIRGQRQPSEDLEVSDSDSNEAYSEMTKGQGGNVRVPSTGQQPNPSPTVWDRIPGELYQAYWASDHCWYPVTVLPWGDLSDVGLVGSLDETDLFKEKLPTCFAVEDSQDGLQIVGWKKDFEGNGRRASERKFPCLFFEGNSAVLAREDESPRPIQNLAWVMAKHLRPINYRHPDGSILNKAGLGEAKAFRERVIMLKSKASGESSRSSSVSLDHDSDVAGAREKPHPKHSTQHKGVKMEEDLDFMFSVFGE